MPPTRTRRRRLASFAPALVLLAATACDSAGPMGPGDNTTEFDAVIDAYVDLTVLPTYADLEAQATTLSDAAEAFANDPTQANLDAAADAWVATREPWESSEGFLFGPVAFLGVDPSLDSWPLDQAQLDQVLQSQFALTPALVRDGLNANLRGFHTIEFLLFRNGSARDAATVTARERDYLVAAAEVLREDAERLHDAWTDGYEGGGSRGFAEEFKDAGQAGSRYISQTDAVLEIIEGMIGIADEVGNGKINDPYAAQNPAIVESWFSWNSLTDFANNIRSIQNAYLGGYHKGTRGVGLTSFVVAEDPALDTRIRAEIQGAIDVIGQIPAPFRSHLDATTQIEAAIDALGTLAATLQNDLRPLVTGG